jgi:hypothetical protein
MDMRVIGICRFEEATMTVIIVGVLIAAMLVCSCVLFLRRRARARG